MNFMFEWQEQYNCSFYYIQYCSFYYIDILMIAFLTIFRRFFEIVPNCQTNVPEHFPEMPEEVRRFPKIAEDFRGRPEYVSIMPATTNFSRI